MDYIIITILVIVLFLNFFLIFKIFTRKEDNKDSIEQANINNELKLYLLKQHNDLKIEVSKLINESDSKSKVELHEFKDGIFKNFDDQLNTINRKIDIKLGEGFKKSDETFVSVVERLSKIDEAQKNIDKLSLEVFSLNSILTDKQTRGTFGEIQLHQILYAVFGDNNSLYKEQVTLSNNKVGDCIIYAPKPLGHIVIDSKFPLNSYQNMYDSSLSKLERDNATKQFKIDIKKHIDVISEKYIIDGETSDQAVMFIPAEAIFSEIVASHNDLVEYSNKKKVWFASPTTLISTLTIIQTIVKNITRDQQAQLIVDELKVLANEFRLYSDRWKKLERTADTLVSDIKDVNITSNKITNRFSDIEEGKLDSILEIKND